MSEDNVWAVVHYIHIRTPHRYVARLFITDVPDDVTASDIKRALTRAGYQFGDFDIPWANHYVDRRPEWDDEVEGAWNRGDCARVAYADIKPPDDGRVAVTLRLPDDLHTRLHRVAQQRGVAAHTVLIEAVSGYIALQESMLGMDGAMSDAPAQRSVEREGGSSAAHGERGG